MLENIHRHMEGGKPAFRSALDGSRQIGFTILSMTLSLVAVFIPVLLMGGLLGRLFHEFAVTISVAILVSGFVSLTLTPMLCSRFLKPEHASRHGRAYQAIENVYQGSLSLYERCLAWVMDHRRSALVFSAAILAGTVGLWTLIPKGFIPSEDIDQITATTENNAMCASPNQSRERPARPAAWSNGVITPNWRLYTALNSAPTATVDISIGKK